MHVAGDDTEAMDALCDELHAILGDRDPLEMCALWVKVKGACEFLKDGLKSWDEVDTVVRLLERHTAEMAATAAKAAKAVAAGAGAAAGDDPYADGFGKTVNARMLTGSVLRRVNHDPLAIIEIVSWLRTERMRNAGKEAHPATAAE